MSLSGNSSAKSNNYRENFFSLDDIIATHEKISCKFEVSVPHLGKSFFKLLAIIGYMYRIPHPPGSSGIPSSPPGPGTWRGRAGHFGLSAGDDVMPH